MKTLVVAPHVDDELIGCYSILVNPSRQVDVLYNFELTEIRLAEARAASTKLGFTIVDHSVELGVYREVYVPSRSDWHADHKEVNAKFRKNATHFYSVDMKNGVFLGNQRSAHKRELLDTLYPSQAALWESNSKYFLFEDIQERDYDEYSSFVFLHRYNITLLSKYRAGVSTALREMLAFTRETAAPDYVALQNMIMDTVCEVCVQGYVSVEDRFSPTLRKLESR